MGGMGLSGRIRRSGAWLDRARRASCQLKAAFTCGLLKRTKVAEDADIVQVLRRAASTTLGREPEIVGETPWMDAALFSAAGIPTVVLGPGGAGAHAVVEWSDLKQVAQCVDILRMAAAEFCG